LYDCDVIASDLTVVGEGVDPCDARDFNTLHARRVRRSGDPCDSTVVDPTPDIVLFDPPSRGLPLHAQIYGEDDDIRDIAFLERDDWISTVADIAIRATAYLAHDGFVSLLLRCGFRLQADAVADPDLLDDFKAAVQGKVLITHEMPLAYGTLRNQTSLGTARVPAVHLVLRKAP
jgi:hypothetical protein